MINESPILHNNCFLISFIGLKFNFLISIIFVLIGFLIFLFKGKDIFQDLIIKKIYKTL